MAEWNTPKNCIEHCVPTLESYLIEHCAPTLASIKTAGLFSFRFSCKKEVMEELNRLNRNLNEKGVFLKDVLWKEDYVLIYTYRRSHLEKDLRQSAVKEILLSFGYPVKEAGTHVHGSEITDFALSESCIGFLKERLRKCDGFPHEIGVFLGYPPEDVKGFIAHKGRDCKYCGLWKVYCNEKETIQLFHKINKCTRIYLQVFSEGRNITQMTVSA